jgi:putative membrane protein
MTGWYSGVMAAHVIAVISWMAGALYLPRLFVYHCQVEPESETAQKFKVMERRLLHAITFPAAIASWLLGLFLVSQIGLAGQGWLHGKLLLVLGLSIFTLWMEKWRRAFAAGHYPHGERFFRVVNEIPTLLMILIVILVVTKPF